MNSHWEARHFELPQPAPGSGRWRVAVNTAMASPQDSFEPGAEPPLGDQGHFLLAPYAVAVLLARAHR